MSRPTPSYSRADTGKLLIEASLALRDAETDDQITQAWADFDQAVDDYRETPNDPPANVGSGLTMRLYFNDADPVAVCACGWRGHGDAINDAVLAWTKHVTSTPCREQL